MAAQDFSFTAGGGLSPTSFALDDDLDPGLSNTQQFNDVPAGSGYSVAETVPGGWSQASATCDDGSPVSNISLAAGEHVTCTFANNQHGSIVVVENSTPNDPQDFDFTAGGGLSPASFQLDDDANPNPVQHEDVRGRGARRRLLAVRDRAQRLGPDQRDLRRRQPGFERERGAR